MAKKKKKKVRPVKSMKGIEKAYQVQLNKLGKALIVYAKKNILEYLKLNKSAYVIDSKTSTKDIGLSDILGAKFDQMKSQFSGVAALNFANTTAEKFVEKTTRSNEKSFNKAIEKTTGVNMGSVISNEGLEDFVKLNINKNTELINNLSADYIKQVEVIVNNGVASGARYETIAKEIIGKKSASKQLINRIKTIAKNEVQTINAQISVRRSSMLGITKGIFETSDDEKVRKCHEELDGVEYVIKKGAWSKTCQKWIQPGITDINCRCNFSPIIEV